MQRFCFWVSPISILLLLVFYTHFKVSQFLSNQTLALLYTLLLFAIMLGWEVIYRYNGFLANKFYFRSLAWVGSTLFGVWTTFVIFSFIADVGCLTILAAMKSLDLISLNQIQNAISSQWISAAIFIVALLISGFGLKAVLLGPKIIEVFIPIKGMPALLKEIKIVQISDLHVGALIRRDYVEKVVLKINELKPDLIVFTGDAVDGTAAVLMDQLLPLRELNASFGKFYVTGNHEYYWGAEQWIKSMKELGFIPLVNENRVVNFGGGKILIAGVTDASANLFLSSHKPDLQKAIFSNEECNFKILLSHSPRILYAAEQAGFDLQLSGHTHAGQFFPFSLLVPLVYKYHTGLNRQNKMWLYINSGTGSWGPMNRFCVHSEITVIRFKDEENAEELKL